MTTIIQIRAEQVQIGDIERHVTGQGRLTPWRRVAQIQSNGGLFVTFLYEGSRGLDRVGGAVRRLDLVEVQQDS